VVQKRVGGDIITGANGTALRTVYSILLVQRIKNPRDTITLNLLNGWSRVNVPVVLGVRPSP
jgi:hypothetical protein